MSHQFQFDVFVSHSAKDKPIVRELAARLKNDGLGIWLDEEQIEPGDNVPAKIEEGLRSSRVLLLCMSANAFSSDWAQLESQTFTFRDPLNKERCFVPLRLDDAPIEGSLAQFRYIDWLPQNEQKYRDLLNACRLKPQRGRERDTIRTFGIDPTVYPPEIRTMLFNANRAELNGDFWIAEAKFDEAAKALVYMKHSDESVEALKARAHFNRRLGTDLRKQYKGIIEPTLVKVFDDQNHFLYSRPKREVHDAGLLHQGVLLLVHLDGEVVFYRRHQLQTYPNKFDFFGGHTADIDQSAFDTARREANEELQLYAHGNRLHIPDHWIHLIGDEHQFVWYAPNNRERSTLFVVEIPRHPGISLRISDEAADGRSIVSIPDYELDSLSNLLAAYKSGEREFADGAERVMIEIARNLNVRAQLGKWFPDILL
jgi:hypothetical protein